MRAKIEKFEDLEVWQNAVQLSTEIYRYFQLCKDYGLKDQLCRASVSIPSNIAEGYERHTNKEFIHFLYISKGSTGELRTQLLIAFRLGYLSEKDYLILKESSMHISAQLYQLIKTRKERFN